MERARSATGLDDFGEDSFREGLEMLVASIDREARLNEAGKASSDGQIVAFLSNRLKVEDWYRRHPEIDDQEIRGPLFGLGLPRTGSTALSQILGADPNTRFIRNWEALQPCPPPESATEHDDPRIALAEQMLARRNQMFPRMKAMVPSTATGPVECSTFQAYDFKSQLFQAMAHVPTYVEWLNHKADLVPTYRYLKRVMKLLQWRCPPTRWRLKNPGHSLFITALDEVFPDARFWMTHRDIASVLPSVADLYYELSKPSSDHVDMAYLGSENAEWTELGLRRLIAFRDKGGQDHRFFDIHFAPFQKDPYPILDQLYAFLGEELSEETKKRMEEWRRAMPRDTYERLPPSAFGIDLDALRERFRFYTDRFGVLEAR